MVIFIVTEVGRAVVAETPHAVVLGVVEEDATLVGIPNPFIGLVCDIGLRYGGAHFIEVAVAFVFVFAIDAVADCT